MTEFINVYRPSRKSEVNQGCWQRYLILGIAANVAFWGAALLYLKLTPPKYTSYSAITLPGAGSAANVSLPGIGQASYENSSPYASTTQDPRANYKFIATSEPVLKAAAAQLRMPVKRFGEPRIKIIDDTTIMEVQFKGTSPEEARNKSLALYRSLEARLDDLRIQEVVRRDAGFQAALGSSQRKLEIAQKRLSDYKASSGLTSGDQITDLSSNIEQLRKERAEVVAQQQQVSTRLKQLSASLKLTDQQAADAFVIQSDQILQQNLKNYSDASAALVILESKYLPNYPAVVAEKAKKNAAKTALLNRSKALLGRPVSEANLQQFNLNSTSSGSARENLFQQLITVNADQQGLQSQAQAVEEQINQLQDRLKNLGQQESTLDTLKRNVQISEAVFSSTLARLDMGRSNIFASYPLMQIVTEPSLPDAPSSPQEKFVLLGTVLGSLLFNLGLVLLWRRERKSYLTDKVVNKQTHVEYETSKF